MYRLKKGQETFEVVDGPDAGKSFARGGVYESVPESEKHRFELAPGPGTSARLIKKMAGKPAREPVKTTAPGPDGNTKPADTADKKGD